MVVVVVRDEHDVDVRQLGERDARRQMALRADEATRRGALGEDRVGSRLSPPTCASTVAWPIQVTAGCMAAPAAALARTKARSAATRGVGASGGGGRSFAPGRSTPAQQRARPLRLEVGGRLFSEAVRAAVPARPYRGRGRRAAQAARAQPVAASGGGAPRRRADRRQAGSRRQARSWQTRRRGDSRRGNGEVQASSRPCDNDVRHCGGNATVGNTSLRILPPLCEVCLGHLDQRTTHDDQALRQGGAPFPRSAPMDFEGGEDEEPVDDFVPLTRAEAEALRARLPMLSPWRVVAVQAAAGVLCVAVAVARRRRPASRRRRSTAWRRCCCRSRCWRAACRGRGAAIRCRRRSAS